MRLFVVLGCLWVNNTGNKMVAEQMDNTELRKEMSEQPARWNASLSKYTDLGAAIAAELMIGFWFGVGVILAVGVADGLNYCIGALTSSGSK